MKKIKAGTSAPADTATKSILKRADKIETTRGESKKSKKRNKSAGFVLEEGEAAPKKNKTEDTPVAKKREPKVYRTTRVKKNKKNRVFKDNPVDDEMEPSPTIAAAVAPNTLERKATKVREVTETVTSETVQSKLETGDEYNNNVPEKSKKRKRPKKTKTDTKEPEQKIRREPSLEDELTEELENMHIGSMGGNRPNLALLLEDMVPVVPKLNKPKPEKKPAPPAPKPDVTGSTDANGNKFNLKKVVKWTKRRWNKDRKEATSESSLSSQVVIHNLPVEMTFENRKNLVKVFEKHGTIKRIGETEVHPTNTAVEIYSTTIYYEKEEAAIKALKEDNTTFEDAIIRVQRPMPPTETTAVARSYTDLSVYMEELQEVFGSAGPLRGIRAASRRGSGLAFVEYYGPEGVERALALSGNIRISGKKVYVNRYDKRKMPSEPAETS